MSLSKTYPCSSVQWSEARQRDVLYETVVFHCRKKCEICGFNPDEAARRLREGKFLTNRRGGRTLHFPPAKKEDKE